MAAHTQRVRWLTCDVPGCTERSSEVRGPINLIRDTYRQMGGWSVISDQDVCPAHTDGRLPMPESFCEG